MKPFSNRRGGAVTAILLFIGVSLLVAGGFWYYISYSGGGSMDIAGNSSGVAGEDAQPLEETEVFSAQDAVDDLGSRGVTIVTVAKVDDYSDDAGFLVEYPEFVKAAEKEEMVLLYCPEDEICRLLVTYENSFIVWRPDVRFEDGEPVQETIRLEIISGDSAKTEDGWIIDLKVVNLGNVASRIGGVSINDVDVDKLDVGGFGYSDDEVGAGETGTNAPLDVAVSGIAHVYAYISDSYSNFSSGTTINVKLVCRGVDFIKLVQLA
jgi:hypothetical protein